jgi:hypothetical protein
MRRRKMISTHEYEIEQNATLAPLKEGFYEPKNMAPKDAQLLITISKNLISNTEQTISALTAMISNLKMYKEVMIDCINSEAETMDLTVKYASNPPQQFHSLPGVVSLPPAYNLENIKSDNERFETLKDLREKVEAQKDMYIKILEQEYKAVNGSFKKFLYNDSTFSTFIDSLNKKSNPNY